MGEPNWITDFDGRFPSYPELQATFPTVGYVSDNSTNSISYPTIDGNRFMEIYYEMYSADAWEWISIESAWQTGEINVYNYGNALMFRAKAVEEEGLDMGRLEITFSGSGDAISDSIALTKSWKNYILLFEDFEKDGQEIFSPQSALSNNININWAPIPRQASVGIKGKFQIDDIKFVYYVEKR